MDEKPTFSVSDHYTPDDPEVQEKEKEINYYIGLYRVAMRAQSHLIQEVLIYQDKADKATTKPKKDLYLKKVDKVRNEFQDVLVRVANISTYLEAEGIDVSKLMDDAYADTDPEQDEKADSSDSEDQEETKE